MAFNIANNISGNINSIERIAAQYNNSDVFKKWLNAYLNEGNYICESICNFAEFFNVDNAAGDWLAVIGRIVGMPRMAFDSSNLPIFGFDGDITNFGFNEGVFTDGTYGSGNIDSTDTIYRRMIKAKVLKNSSNCCLNDLAKSIAILSLRTDFEFVDTGTAMQIGINFLDSELDLLSTSLIKDFDLLPLAMGVKLTDVYFI